VLEQAATTGSPSANVVAAIWLIVFTGARK
jgi:hypothetical protein